MGLDAIPEGVEGHLRDPRRTDEIEGTETGIHGICLAPSLPALAWMLLRVGFASVLRVHPPADGYEQLVRGRRAMFVASVEKNGVR